MNKCKNYFTNEKLFNQNEILTHWKEEQECWYFLLVDVIEASTETDRPRKYGVTLNQN
jgi:hypothetical protein